MPISGLEDAQATLKPLLGEGAAYAFGIALLASGLSSSTVGTMAGQMIVDGLRTEWYYAGQDEITRATSMFLESGHELGYV